MSPDSRVVTELPLLIADLFEAAGAMRAHGDRLAAHAHQTQARWQLLSVLADGEWTVAQAARRLGVVRQSVQRIARELEVDGLLVAIPNPRHARSPLLRLTQPGRSALEQITRVAVDWHREAAEVMSLSDVVTTRALLRRLIEACAAAARSAPRRRRSGRV